ncbi:MAG: hypothetical protein EOO59_13835 [Hymenobacter sp.]|nr:MAG: hypothetical protein EOO59_13835 [Hymenobacter sp.]
MPSTKTWLLLASLLTSLLLAHQQTQPRAASAARPAAVPAPRRLLSRPRVALSPARPLGLTATFAPAAAL